MMMRAMLPLNATPVYLLQVNFPNRAVRYLLRAKLFGDREATEDF